MTIAFARAFSLIRRGAAGLACDDDGVALGPMRFVEAVIDPSGQRFYRMRPMPEVTQALRRAYRSAPDQIERVGRGLARIARLLTAGKQGQACIRAVQLAFPEIAPEAMTKLAYAASLQKDNPNWAGEPRVPGGNPDGGEWTNDGGEDANVRPAGAPTSPLQGERADEPNVRQVAAPVSVVQAKKERFVDAHLADAQKAADQLGIPVETSSECRPWSRLGGPVALQCKATTILASTTRHPMPSATCKP